MSAKTSSFMIDTNLEQKSECAMRVLIRGYVTCQCEGEHPKSTEKALGVRIEKQIESLFA